MWGTACQCHALRPSSVTGTTSPEVGSYIVVRILQHVALVWVCAGCPVQWLLVAFAAPKLEGALGAQGLGCSLVGCSGLRYPHPLGSLHVPDPCMGSRDLTACPVLVVLLGYAKLTGDTRTAPGLPSKETCAAALEESQECRTQRGHEVARQPQPGVLGAAGRAVPEPGQPRRGHSGGHLRGRWGGTGRGRLRTRLPEFCQHPPARWAPCSTPFAWPWAALGATHAAACFQQHGAAQPRSRSPCPWLGPRTIVLQ